MRSTNIFGGWLIGGLGWRSSFLVLVPLGAATLAAAWRSLPADRPARREGAPAFDAAGMLLLAFFTWLAGSAGVAFSVNTISIVAFALLAVSLLFGYWQRDELAQEWRERRRYFLTVELVALAFFRESKDVDFER